MNDKARIEELEEALKKAQERINSLEGQLEKQKKSAKAAREDLKKKDLSSISFSDKMKEVVSLVYPDIDVSKLP